MFTLVSCRPFGLFEWMPIARFFQFCGLKIVKFALLAGTVEET